MKTAQHNIEHVCPGGPPRCTLGTPGKLEAYPLLSKNTHVTYRRSLYFSGTVIFSAQGSTQLPIWRTFIPPPRRRVGSRASCRNCRCSELGTKHFATPGNPRLISISYFTGCCLHSFLQPWNNGKEVPRLDLTSSTTPGLQIHKFDHTRTANTIPTW